MGACFQHCVRWDEEQGRVCDRVISSSTLRFLLSGLNCVDVLKDSLTICVVVLHLILECEDVDCIQSTTDGLEVGQKLSCTQRNRSFMSTVLYAVFHAFHVFADASRSSHLSVVRGWAPVFNIAFVGMRSRVASVIGLFPVPRFGFF